MALSVTKRLHGIGLVCNIERWILETQECHFNSKGSEGTTAVWGGGGMALCWSLLCA
jgi:hypothetical protein